MILTWRDAVSSTLVGAAAATYSVYGPGVLPVQPAAAASLLLGAVMTIVAYGRIRLERPARATIVAASALTSAAVVAGATAATTGEPAALAVSAGCLIVSWLLSLARHLTAGRVTDRELRRFLERQHARDHGT
jgi:hypothetical protein